MNYKSQIEELSSQIKDLEDRAANLQVESFDLRQKREELIARMIVEEKLMVDTEWELTMDHNSTASLSFKKDNKGSINYIVELAKADYHSWFEIMDGVSLRFDDNEISISFKDSKLVIPFAKKNGLKISGNNLTNKLAQLKRDVAALEIICHQFSLDKK
jgi:DUF4097 and DUF4098 domain-containing protein YvlB